MMASISIGITSLLVRAAVVSVVAVSVPLLGLRRGVGRNHLLLRTQIEFDFFLVCADCARCKCGGCVRTSI